MAEARIITIPYSPRRIFLPFHNRKQRFSAIVAHRRAGKTVAHINELIKTALTCKLPNPRTAYFCPLYKQAKDTAWTYAKESARVIPGSKANESELRIDFPNGGRFKLYGADNVHSLRGVYFDDVVLDEYADMRPSLYSEVIRITLVDRKGRASFIGTPRGKNDFYKICNLAKNSPDEWYYTELKASETGLYPASELNSAKKTMTEEQYLQEFECSFEASILGAFYGKEIYLAEQQGRIKDFDYDPNFKVSTAWDLGWSDDTSIWFYQVVAGEIRIIDYLFNSGEDINYYSGELLKKPYKYNIHWLPHDAKAKTLASGGKSIQEQLSANLGWGNIRIVPDLSLMDGIQAARLMMPRCWFNLKNCEEGIEALKQYQREWDEQRKCFKDKPKHDWTSHPADAFRYLALSWQEEFKTESRPKIVKDYGLTFKNGYVWEDSDEETNWKLI